MSTLLMCSLLYYIYLVITQCIVCNLKYILRWPDSTQPLLWTLKLQNLVVLVLACFAIHCSYSLAGLSCLFSWVEKPDNFPGTTSSLGLPEDRRNIF